MWLTVNRSGRSTPFEDYLHGMVTVDTRAIARCSCKDHDEGIGEVTAWFRV